MPGFSSPVRLCFSPGPLPPPSLTSISSPGDGVDGRMNDATLPPSPPQTSAGSLLSPLAYPRNMQTARTLPHSRRSVHGSNTRLPGMRIWSDSSRVR
jgi:hypothetical protein